MPDPNPMEFTEREKILIYCLRDPEISSRGRIYGYDLAFGIGSLLCLILALVRQEMALGFVAYFLVVGRLAFNFVEGQRWLVDYQSIVGKFEAKLEAANALQSRLE
ncbi:MAG: hypothetical protein J0L84_04220 [Verrucomicrobia bacterium]|nr:hypothetical protein [Verrucomicrobiota bacterium]